jgi:Reverse transcriptase (RNA-dependent DNA polymerase)
MADWEPKQKQYAHFDAPLSKREMRKLATDSTRVAHHQFFPFLRFVEEWQPFRRKRGKPGPKPDRKSRTIRYASRRDTAVFSYYRSLLSDRYEARLAELGLEDAVLAYRRILTPAGSGKSNINFALEAFQEISRHSSSVVLALDISKFFESLDHERLEAAWASLLDVTELPPDHKHVFENITRYADVSRDEALVRLGHAKWLSAGAGQVLRITAKPIPIQLCSPAEFRLKVGGRGGIYPKLIERHADPHGVPQGAPLSDLLANAYLMTFDVELKRYASALGGRYFRYSDDILLVIPSTNPKEADAAEAFAASCIKASGNALQIKPAKTSAYLYERKGGELNFSHLRGRAPNGLEYLGFRFDGEKAHVRASTLSRLHRNITFAARAAAKGHVARYPGKSLSQLIAKFDLSDFMQRYGRVEDFDPRSKPKGWTFWTYAKRSSAVFGAMGSPIDRQLSRYRSFVKRQIEKEISDAV